MARITTSPHCIALKKWKDKTMEVKKIKNEYGLTVWQVKDEGCIQEFWTLKEALDYIDYVKSIEG